MLKRTHQKKELGGGGVTQVTNNKTLKNGDCIIME